MDARSPTHPSWDRVIWAVAVVCSVIVLWVLLSPAYVPLQDFPNHWYLLEVDLSLGSDHPVFARPAYPPVTYSLAHHVSRFLAPFLGSDYALRLLCVGAALAFPLAVAHLARSIGLRPVWAMAWSLPWMLSWSLKMGFIHYVLGLPFALLAGSYAVRVCREGRWPDVAALGGFAFLAYMSNATVVVIVGAVCLAAIASFPDPKRAAMMVFIAALPGLCAVGYDLAIGSFGYVTPEASAPAPPGAGYHRIDQTMVLMVTRSLGIPSLLQGLFFVPVVLGLAWFSARVRRHERTGEKRFLLVLCLFGLGLVFGLPDAVGVASYVGSRLMILLSVAVILLATRGIEGAGRKVQGGALAAIVLALGTSAFAMHTRSEKMAATLAGVQQVNGTYLTAYAADRCNENSGAYAGHWQYLRHSWAYALGPKGYTPYAFAWGGYHRFAYRPDVYLETLHAPPESINGDQAGDGDCTGWNIARYRASLLWPGYDGVLLIGPPSAIDDVLRHRKGPREQRRLAPGISLVRHRQGLPQELMAASHEWMFRRGFRNGTYDDGMMAVEGRTADIRVLASGSGSNTLSFQSELRPGRATTSVEVSLAGTVLGRVPLQSGRARYKLGVPPGIVRRGWNTLRFKFAKPVDGETWALGQPAFARRH